jgi:hypothetical protein
MVFAVLVGVAAVICVGLLLIGSIRQSADQQQAAAKGLQLLLDNLTPGQRRQYQKLGYFDVVGSKTKNRYRIHHGTSRNVHLLKENDRLGSGKCFEPRGPLVAGDCMLAQKIALENCEEDVLLMARRF